MYPLANFLLNVFLFFCLVLIQRILVHVYMLQGRCERKPICIWIPHNLQQEDITLHHNYSSIFLWLPCGKYLDLQKIERKLCYSTIPKEKKTLIARARNIWVFYQPRFVRFQWTCETLLQNIHINWIGYLTQYAFKSIPYSLTKRQHPCHDKGVWKPLGCPFSLNSKELCIIKKKEKKCITQKKKFVLILEVTFR